MKIQLLSIALMILLLANCSEKKTVTEAASVGTDSTAIPSVSTSGPSINEESTTKVLEHHWAAFNANDLEATMADYTDEHAKAGIDARLPAIETWHNQYPDYEITVEIPEYNAICPKTELPDFGHLTIRYVPDRLCLELKSLKLYIVAYRNVGIFYENAVNRILEDCVAACRPKRMSVSGRFSSRGGISSVVEARYPRD